MYADSKQKSYEITKTQIFTVYDMAKHDALNIRNLNLACSSSRPLNWPKLNTIKHDLLLKAWISRNFAYSAKVKL